MKPATQLLTPSLTMKLLRWDPTTLLQPPPFINSVFFCNYSPTSATLTWTNVYSSVVIAFHWHDCYCHNMPFNQRKALSLCLCASLTLTTFTHKTHCHKKIKVNKINLKVKFVLLSERSRTYGPKNRKLSISTIGSLKGRIPPRCYRAKPHQPKFADTD